MSLTRKQFDSFTRKLSAYDINEQQYHARVEICVGTDWRVVTDTCRLEKNIPVIHKALADMLFVYMSENHPKAKPKECVKLGEPSENALTVGMKMW
jgi:hypothetical protein